MTEYKAEFEGREAAYRAVWESGLLTQNVYTNARIWRAVEAALDAIEGDRP